MISALFYIPELTDDQALFCRLGLLTTDGCGIGDHFSVPYIFLHKIQITSLLLAFSELGVIQQEGPRAGAGLGTCA